jgi:hypothetical protein
MRDALRFGANGPRALALALLACALALRFLVPAGWMPVSDARGFHLTLCSGVGPMDMPAMAMQQPMAGMDHHGPSPSRDQATQDHLCPFAGLGLALTEPVLPAIVALPPTDAVFAPSRPLAIAIGHGLAAPPPPPTGPPALG